MTARAGHFSSGSSSFDAVLIALALLVILSSVFISYIMSITEKEKKEAEEIIKQREDSQRALDRETLRNLHVMQREGNKMISDILSAERTGDLIIAGEGATIVNRSTLVNSLNSIAKQSPDVAESLKIVGGLIQQSGNEIAAKNFNELTSRISKGDSQVVVSALWDKIINILPEINKFGDFAAKIAGFIEKMS